MTMKNKSDHDLLIEINVKQDEQIKQFANHLQHHWTVTIMALSAALTGLFTLMVGIILLYLQVKGVN